MYFTVLSIFPEMFDPFWGHGIVRRAIENKKIFASAVSIRNYAADPHQVTDDRPYGGGSGMVMKPEPLAAAIRDANKTLHTAKTVLLTPQGCVFNQQMARELASFEGLILVCGRYEGVDERICHDLIDYEISIGDYVLTGGELPAMVLIEGLVRLLPGVLGNPESIETESFGGGDFLEGPQYTRPPIYRGLEVPEVLRSGNHALIEQWRLEHALARTRERRPDLVDRAGGAVSSSPDTDGSDGSAGNRKTRENGKSARDERIEDDN